MLKCPNPNCPHGPKCRMTTELGQVEMGAMAIGPVTDDLIERFELKHYGEALGEVVRMLLYALDSVPDEVPHDSYIAQLLKAYQSDAVLRERQTPLTHEFANEIWLMSEITPGLAQVEFEPHVLCSVLTVVAGMHLAFQFADEPEEPLHAAIVKYVAPLSMLFRVLDLHQRHAADEHPRPTCVMDIEISIRSNRP